MHMRPQRNQTALPLCEIVHSRPTQRGKTEYFLDAGMSHNAPSSSHDALVSVSLQGVAHYYFTGGVHGAPRDRRPLRAQRAVSWQGLEATLDVTQAPLILPQFPEVIDQPRMGHIQPGKLPVQILTVETNQDEQNFDPCSCNFGIPPHASALEHSSP